MAFGGTIDVIVPMTALWRLILRRGQAAIVGASAIIQYGRKTCTCKNAGEDGRYEFRGSVWHVQLR